MSLLLVFIVSSKRTRIFLYLRLHSVVSGLSPQRLGATLPP